MYIIKLLSGQIKSRLFLTSFTKNPLLTYSTINVQEWHPRPNLKGCDASWTDMEFMQIIVILIQSLIHHSIKGGEGGTVGSESLPEAFLRESTNKGEMEVKLLLNS
jgi:hypothetical protein